MTALDPAALFDAIARFPHDEARVTDLLNDAGDQWPALLLEAAAVAARHVADTSDRDALRLTRHQQEEPMDSNALPRAVDIDGTVHKHDCPALLVLEHERVPLHDAVLRLAAGFDACPCCLPRTADALGGRS